MIDVKNMTAKKGTFTLDAISFSIAPGEIVGYIGRNGSGKTTTIECMTGQYPISSGDYHIFGKRFWQLNEEELEQIGYVDSTSSRYRFYSFSALCRYLKKNYSHFDKELLERYYSRFELSRERRSGELSLGQYEKMMFAVELSHGTKMLFVDETTASLDPLGKEVLFDVLREFAAEGGSVFITSHILSDLEKVCDRILVIDNGRLFLDTTPDDLKERYAVIQVTQENRCVIPEEAVLFEKRGEYSDTLLVERNMVNETYIDRTSSLDEIIVKFLEMKNAEQTKERKQK